MERQFYFGKIALRGNRKENAVDVTIELKEYENKQPVFTASGRVWNRTHTNLRLGGQCLDEIAKYIKNPVFKEIHRLWKLYHPNDMNAGTIEQEKALNEAVKMGIFPSMSANYYKEHCEYLKSIGLYEVEYNGKPYKYGHGWLYREIPESDLNKIKELLKEGLAYNK